MIGDRYVLGEGYVRVTGRTVGGIDQHYWVGLVADPAFIGPLHDPPTVLLDMEALRAATPDGPMKVGPFDDAQPHPHPERRRKYRLVLEVVEEPGS